MLALLSPAKTLDFETDPPFEQHSYPRFLRQSSQLITYAKKLDRSQIQRLMKVSEKIADLNYQRFQNWHSDYDLSSARHALFAFKGDVYTGLDATNLDQDAVQFADQHLRILSGLYGLLRPLDLILPYRLEMGIALANDKGKNLYQFWQDQISLQINQDLAEQGDDILINLASDEYYKAVAQSSLKARTIKVVFLDQKQGQYKVISFHAKKARGYMAHFMLKNQLQKPAELAEFDSHGYYFDKINSTENEFVFKRDEVEV